MKYDHNKSYGYPILRPFVENETNESDYAGYSFEPSFNPMVPPENPKRLRIEVETYLQEPTLKIAVIEQRAKIKLIVACRETYFTKSFDINVDMDTIELDVDDLHGRVELTLFVIAQKEFKLTSANFHPDFDGAKFDIVKGNILAQSFTQEVFIHKEFFRNARSIISIATNDSLSDGDYIVSLDSDYIEISMNSDLNAKINGLLETKGSEPVEALNSIFVPAVTHALYELNERNELADYKWAQVLKMQLETIKSNQPMRDEIYNQAQTLFKKPLSKIAVVPE